MMRCSLRQRLTLWYAGSLIVLLAVFGGLIDALMYERLLSRTDFELDEELHELVLEVNLSHDRHDLLRQLQLRFSDHNSFEFQVLTDSEERIFQSRNLSPLMLPAPQLESNRPHFSTAQLPVLGDSRIASQRIVSAQGPLTVQVVMPLGRYLAELRDLRRLMLTVGPLMTLLSIGGGYWLAGRSLNPVARMTSAAERITAEQLAERLEAANPHDELGRLAVAFNGLLDRLERSFLELRQFTADAAHEIRTPLAVIRSSAEVALHATRSSAYYQECLQTISEEIERLTSLSNQLLLLAREDAGLKDDLPQRVNITDLLEQVAHDLEPLADDGVLTIEYDLAREAWLLGDRERLRRVFLNLMDNAIKFTPSGGNILVRLIIDDADAEVTVRDTGFGIPPEHLPHIFDRFYRVDPSRNRESGGAGLGLAICRAIVNRHGGNITVESDIGSGTTVRVVLPVLQVKIVPAPRYGVVSVPALLH